MKGCITVLLLLVVLLIGGVWYIFRPVALGVTYTSADFEAAKKKIGVTYESLPANSIGTSIIVSGSHPVDQSFTSSELTALADNRHQQYVYFPFRSVQIRVNSDGSVEGAATVGFQDAVRYLLALGVAQKDIEEGAKKFNVPNTTLPVYFKVSGSVVHNSSNITVGAAKIANISVPGNLIQEYVPALNALIDSVIKSRQPSYNVERLEVVNSNVHFKGTSPDKEQAAQRL